MILPWFVLNLEGDSPPPPPAPSLRRTLRGLLVNNSDVTSIVGNRIHPGGLPQSPVYPCVVQTVVGRYDELDFEGVTDITTLRVKVSCWAPRLSDAEDLAIAVRKAILSAPGSNGVEDATPEDEFDQAENPPTGSDEYLNQIVLMFRVWIRHA